MAEQPARSRQTPMLPGAMAPDEVGAVVPGSALPAPPALPALPALPAGGGAAEAGVPSPGAPSPGAQPARQLSELPKDELEHLAEEFGIDASAHETAQELVTAIHQRRQMIAALDREALLDVIKWGRRPVPYNASKEQIVQEIARIKSMRFAGLSARGLMALAKLRGLRIRGDEQVPQLVRKLKKQEGFFARINRKRRAVVGSLVAKMVGETGGGSDYQFLPPQQGGGVSAAPRPASLKEEIEESGLIGGITGRLKKSADSYLNQKLDEIEARIDRKLDEIDRRLAEWRDKEIANRIRILKITLWLSVIVAAVVLVYSYVRVYFIAPPPPTPTVQMEPRK